MARRKNTGKGWFNHSHEHSLASKGVKTAVKDNPSARVKVMKAKPYETNFMGLKRAKFDKSGNKMIFNSQLKSFDKQADLITSGNALTDVQTSWFIRGYKDRGKGLVDYPKNKREFGNLREFDLRTFKYLPNNVREAVYENTKGEKSIILYNFHYWDSKHQKQNVGWVLTTPDHKFITKIIDGSGNWGKKNSVITEALPYITK